MLGGVGLCQVAVHLAYATARGHAVIDRALYLPAAWAADEERRELAQVPQEEVSAARPAQALAMLRRAVAAGIRAAFFTGDEVYGSREMRLGCRELGLGHVVAVRADHRVTLPCGKATTVTDALTLLPDTAWQRLRTGTGSKGTRDYDWAMLAVRHDDISDGDQAAHPAGESVLLVRRHRYTRTLSFYRCRSPQPVSVARLVGVVCRRRKIEELFQGMKATIGTRAGSSAGPPGTAGAARP